MTPRPLHEPVAITGIGIVTSLGFGKEDNWTAMHEGRSGARLIERFETEGLRTKFAASVDDVIDPRATATDRGAALAGMAVEEALAEAGIGSRGGFPGPLVIAVPPTEMDWRQRLALAATAPRAERSYEGLVNATNAHPAFHVLTRFGEVASRIADRFGTLGAPVTACTACASGATAIQMAVEAIRRGDCDAALAVATEGSLQPEMLTRFSLLSALSTRNDDPAGASRPFDAGRDGFVIGEGAAALALESVRSARARGARILGAVRGCGERGDGFHRTRSSPDGTAAADAMRRAIADAALDPDDIDYVNAHGTSTPENDRMETLSCRLVFGERMQRLPISSTKSMTGHTLTAAGAIEAAATLLMLARQTILPTINVRTPDPELAIDAVRDAPRCARLAHAISNSFGFGGQNVALVLSAEA